MYSFPCCPLPLPSDLTSSSIKIRLCKDYEMYVDDDARWMIYDDDVLKQATTTTHAAI